MHSNIIANTVNTARAAAAAVAVLCSAQAVADPPSFAKGADLSWVTELESRGYRWRDAAGAEKECFALMKSLGFNAVRLRVWVDPKDGWNAGASAVRKCCPRAKVIVHCDRGEKWGDLAGVLNAAKKVDYDIFGVSLYPPQDWGAAIRACAENLARVKREYGKMTMVCEFGMPTHPFDPARDAASELLKAMRRTKGRAAAASSTGSPSRSPRRTATSSAPRRAKESSPRPLPPSPRSPADALRRSCGDRLESIRVG